MGPLNQIQASHLNIGEYYHIETKKDGFCEVEVAEVSGYIQETILVIGGLPPWGVYMTFREGRIYANVRYFGSEDYNKTWRVWPDRPSVEESRCVPWG